MPLKTAQWQKKIEVSAIIGHSLSPHPITDRLCPIFKEKEKCLMKSFMLISIPKERYDHMVESYSAVVAENEESIL